MTYKLSELRNNTRTIFNEAENGEVVYIERYGKLFKLTQAGIDGQVPRVEEIIDKPVESLKNKVSAGTLCKHGFDPKFCKHAKPGKPCK